MSEQPDTAAHTITGDGTIPADATVQTRDSEIAKTVRDDVDSHACEGCGQTFDEIGELLDHDCEEDWDGPDPDDDIPTALADGGEALDITMEEFRERQNEWSSTAREDEPKCEECGSRVLTPKSRNNCGPDRENDEPYRCQNCGEHVEGSGTTAATDGGEPSESRRSSSELRSDGGLKRMEDADPKTTPERAYQKSPQVRKDILAEIVRLDDQDETVRYSDVRSEDAPQSVRALAFETFLQHATILAMEDLIERGAFHETQTTVKPTEAAVEIVGDSNE